MQRQRALHWTRIAAWLALALGLASIVAGGRVLFDPAAHEAAGRIVPFVLVFNFLAGFSYVVAALGLTRNKRWAALLAVAIAACTAAVGLLFALHVSRGGAYEARTAVALSVRTLFWTLLAWLSCRAIGCRTRARPADPQGQAG